MLRFTVRILTLDPGDRRIGVALSDPSRNIAHGLKVYMRGSRARDPDETLGPRARKIMEFAKGIEIMTRGAVDFRDDRLSTDEANGIFHMASVNRKKRKASNDMTASQIILQEYLDAKSHE